jgi:hypothetical protein
VSEFARTGNRREAPQARAGRRIVGVDEAANPELPAGDAGDDLVLHRQRRAGDAESLHRIGDLHFPEQRTGPRVERQERRVQRAHEDRSPSTATPRLNGLISLGLRTFCGR